MDNALLEDIRRETAAAVRELLDTAALSAGQVLVVGCSSSEILGRHIGRAGSMEAAAAVVDVLLPEVQRRGVFLAAQCCEHLNRALVLEAEAAARYGWEPVAVVPQPHAGGSFAATVYKRLRQPVAVEAVAAHAGMDIGDTLIGMHLKQVAVPVRLQVRRIGEANVVCARTRPKYIGGPRAVYAADEA